MFCEMPTVENILKRMDIVDLFMEFFTFSSTTKCGFDFEVNCRY